MTHSKQSIRDKKYRAKIRLIVVDHYSKGTLSCRCCGEKHFDFLTIDHVYGGGNKHRKKLGGCRSLYIWLIKQKFPKGYQILCFNCNCVKNRGAKCPHELEKLNGKTTKNKRVKS